MAHWFFFPSHRGDRLTSRPEGGAVAMARAPPTSPSHGERGGPRARADDVRHRVVRWEAEPQGAKSLSPVACQHGTLARRRPGAQHRPQKLPPCAIEGLLASCGHTDDGLLAVPCRLTDIEQP